MVWQKSMDLCREIYRFKRRDKVKGTRDRGQGTGDKGQGTGDRGQVAVYLYLVSHNLDLIKTFEDLLVWQKGILTFDVNNVKR